MKHDFNSLTGSELIAAERRRQIESEGWTPEHDDEHDDGSLALAAICYAAPRRVFLKRDYASSFMFSDPWPTTWDMGWDKRAAYGNGYAVGNGITDPTTYTHDQRLDLLVKAGALIAAEIDRVKRLRGSAATDGVGVVHGNPSQGKPPIDGGRGSE